MPMTVVTVGLRFCCGDCRFPVTATLRCEGNLDGRPDGLAVGLECPHCDRDNTVTFAPDGEVLAVAAHRVGKAFKN